MSTFDLAVVAQSYDATSVEATLASSACGQRGLHGSMGSRWLVIRRHADSASERAATRCELLHGGREERGLGPPVGRRSRAPANGEVRSDPYRSRYAATVATSASHRSAVRLTTGAVPGPLIHRSPVPAASCARARARDSMSWLRSSIACRSAARSAQRLGDQTRR